jgi:hypothetical protein
MKRLLLIAVVVAAAAASSVGDASSVALCAQTTADPALRLVRPHVIALGGRPLLVTPSNRDEVTCFDFTRDGHPDIAVTVSSGGTAGDIGWIVLVRKGSGWRLAHSEGGYKLGLVRKGSDLVSTQPIYRRNDPNCCPSGGFDHERWHWNGSRFVRIRLWHTNHYRP